MFHNYILRYSCYNSVRLTKKKKKKKKKNNNNYFKVSFSCYKVAQQLMKHPNLFLIDHLRAARQNKLTQMYRSCLVCRGILNAT